MTAQTISFEIEEERGNCGYGKSKEHRPLPIIQMGLLMDGNGFPFSFVIFPGNENEQPSLIPVEKKIIKDFGISQSSLYALMQGLLPRIIENSIYRRNVHILSHSLLRRLRSTLRTGHLIQKDGLKVIVLD